MGRLRDYNGPVGTMEFRSFHCTPGVTDRREMKDESRSPSLRDNPTIPHSNLSVVRIVAGGSLLGSSRG